MYCERRRAVGRVDPQEAQQVLELDLGLHGHFLEDRHVQLVAAEDVEPALEMLPVVAPIVVGAKAGTRTGREPATLRAVRVGREGFLEIEQVFALGAHAPGVERVDHVDRVAQHDHQPGVGGDFPDQPRRRLRVDVARRPLANDLGIARLGEEVVVLLVVHPIHEQVAERAAGQFGGEVVGLLEVGQEDLGMALQVLVHRRGAALGCADDEHVRHAPAGSRSGRSGVGGGLRRLGGNGGAGLVGHVAHCGSGDAGGSTGTPALVNRAFLSAVLI